MRLVMVGTGYVGLVTGTCFATLGRHVTCTDSQEKTIQTLQKGDLPFFEPRLDYFVKDAVTKGRLFFSTDVVGATQDADVIFLAVGTPSTEKGDANLSFLMKAIKTIVPTLKENAVLVTKSTVPVGTFHKIQEEIQSLRPQDSIHLVSNPEFLREGEALHDFMNPDRIVIGTDSSYAEQVMKTLYAPFIKKDVPFIVVDPKTAELIKYASNAFLAMKVAYINEMASLCDKLGADDQKVALGMSLDHRIGPHFLKSGPGFGGSCFPKDVLALEKVGEEAALSTPLISAILPSNNARKKRVVQQIIEECGNPLKDKTIGILGITFKANTDDMRDSPSLNIIPALQERGAKIQIYEPTGEERGRHFFQNVFWTTSSYEAATGADALIILTEWHAFAHLDFKRLKNIMHHPLIIDCRGLYDKNELDQYAVTYRSLGQIGQKDGPGKRSSLRASFS